MRMLEVLTLAMTDLDRHPDLLGDIFRRRANAAIVQSVFSAQEMADLAAQLAADGIGIPRAVAPTFKGGLYGNPLVLGSEDLRDYLDDADRFRAAIEALSAVGAGIQARIEAALTRVSGGLVVDVPRAPDGRAYLPFSIRVLVEGDSLPIHYENGTTRYASMKALLPTLDVETVMSFYVPVVLPARGGVLEVFSTDCSGSGDRIIEDLGGPERARPILAARGHVQILPGVGDMLVFDGGRHYHCVTEVEGGSRWTLGGFFAFTKAHDRIVYWS